MNILSSFRVTAVTVMVENAGEGVGPLRLALTIENESIQAAEVAAMLPTASNQAAFPKKYWDQDGALLIADIADAATLAREIIGGTATIVPGGGYSTPMRFEGVDVKNIRFTPEPGHKGRLKMALHVKPGDDEDELVGRLCRMLKTEITLTASRSKADAEREAREKLAADAQGDLLAQQNQEEHEDGPTLAESLEQARIDDAIDLAASSDKNPGLIEQLRKDEQEDIANEAKRKSSDTPAPRTPGQRQVPKGTH